MARPKGIPAHNKLDIEKIKEKLFKVHGNVLSLVEESYINTHTKCKFIDKEYGEWIALPINVIYKSCEHPQRKFKNSSFYLNSESAIIKRNATILEKYGVTHVSQNQEIRKKQIKSLNFTYNLKHWKTNEEILCQGSWEKMVVEWLNLNKVDYSWQIKFEMPDGRIYFVDLFLVKENKFVEIKGKFWGDSKEKWDWFSNKYKNSELWNRNKLKEMGIKVR